jgi:tetratricopeptide (TPR) repeat protein
MDSIRMTPVVPRIYAFLGLLVVPAALALAESPDAADPEALMAAGHWSEAETAAQTMVREEPSGAMGWYFLGRVLFERGRPADLSDAASHLSRAVSLEPGLAPAWFWLGRASGQMAGSGGLVERMRLAGDSRKAFARALELDPESFEFAYALVQFYLHAPAMVGGGSEKAEEVIERFVGRNPAEKLLLEASVSLAGRDDERVVALLSEVGGMDDPMIQRNWREIALQLGRRQLSVHLWNAAVRTYQLIVERLPDLPAGYLGLGRALEGSGRIDEAFEAYGRCVELAPGIPAAVAAKARLDSSGQVDSP